VLVRLTRRLPKARRSYENVGRPKGPVDPFTTLARHIVKPNQAAACLARLIAGEYGRKLDEAAVEAIVLLTLPDQWPAREWPDRVAWFHDWRLKVAGPMRSAPSQEKVIELLRSGRSPNLFVKR
jgi:hypothetical protein